MTSVRLHTFSGSNHGIGVQQGKATHQQIQEALERIPNYEFVKLMKPRYLPTALFVWMAKHRAERILRKDIFEYYAKEAERMRGIAEGAEVDIASIFVLASNGTPSKQAKLSG